MAAYQRALHRCPLQPQRGRAGRQGSSAAHDRRLLRHAGCRPTKDQREQQAASPAGTPHCGRIASLAIAAVA
ncbi:hypothetical protein WR25_08101 [Diploscapter pachys]|uniref:Uncharacterized protein n=1 Tax=Diploscapter pachys TaxID=2018661 RepID=A0A2A2M3Q4_9BILA|nr:hypothetical protein WR25_08101 [Diploscapter pachys]